MYGSATTVGEAGPACAGSEVEGSLLEPLLGRHSSRRRLVRHSALAEPVAVLSPVFTQPAAACAALCSVSAAVIESAAAKFARSSGVYPGRYSLPN